MPMALVRIALANIPYAPSREASVASAESAIAKAALAGAALLCLPECYVPGYRTTSRVGSEPDPRFLEWAWSTVAQAAANAKIAVILGTERVVNGGLVMTALVLDPDGAQQGFQDKVQIDPSEEAIYRPGEGRRLFQTGPMTFGIAICHEGWRYPETVRWAARRGAQVVFHPHFHEAEAGSYRPTVFADPANSFFEKTMLCRAAENSCYFASVNYASSGSPTTSAVVQPDGTVLAWQPYGKPGLLVADIELNAATRLYATRCKSY
jgi:predicted amidohydrolase